MTNSNSPDLLLSPSLRAFISWVKQHLATEGFLNTKDGCVIKVPKLGILLVSPRIFIAYSDSEGAVLPVPHTSRKKPWEQLQWDLEHSGLLSKPDGGDGRSMLFRAEFAKNKYHGYVLENPKQIGINLTDIPFGTYIGSGGRLFTAAAIKAIRHN